MAVTPSTLTSTVAEERSSITGRRTNEEPVSVYETDTYLSLSGGYSYFRPVISRFIFRKSTSVHFTSSVFYSDQF